MSEQENPKNAQASFITHVVELRRRLFICVGAVLAAFILTYTYSVPIYTFLAEPLLGALPADSEYLAYMGVVEPFYTYLKAALVAAIILASPIVIYEIWAFVAPGLYRDEKKWFFPVVCASSVLFFIGTLFAYGVVFPVGFKYLIGIAGSELRPMLSMGDYFSFATKLLIAFGVVFEMPLFVLVLSRIGIVTAGMLFGWWKYALLGAVVIGALLTPPDIFSQLLMAGPIMVLYGLSILVAAVFGKKK